MKSDKKLFGTDGIRGMANEQPMTGEMVMAVGRAIPFVLKKHNIVKTSPRGERKIRIVVGKDTRLANYMLEHALASGICSMGADVILMGPLPTPGVAYVTQSMRADAGIMISASHNPYMDSGIKVFTEDGFKLPDLFEEEIESLVFSKEIDKHRPTGEFIGKAFRIEDAIGRYNVFLKSQFSKEADLVGIKMVVDCANGAAYKVAPLVFEELGAEVFSIGISPNGVNINERCGAMYPTNCAAVTHQIGADLGLALDGDGDRCILSDENGEIVDGDVIIGLCALEMSKNGILKKNTVVTTPMTNIGVELSLKENNISMVRAQVGDRYVVECMRKNNFNLGGEQSGHIIFLDQSTTGDGLVAALKILEIMKSTGKPLSELKKKIRLFPQVCENVKIKRKLPLEEMVELQKEIKAAEDELKQRGRVFVRYSGTESLARVMVEGENLDTIRKISARLSSLIHNQLGN